MKWLKDHFITHVVNCTIEHPNYFTEEFNYLKLNLLDSPKQSLYHVFERVYNYIRTTIGNGGTVYVHCHAGVSRSSSMVIYFVMKVKGWSFPEAFSYVKSLHPRTDPNEGFVIQLISVTPKALRLFSAQSSDVSGVDRMYHPYDLRTRGKNRTRAGSSKYTRPRIIESRSEIVRRF